MELPKIKAVEVTFNDGSTRMVHEPTGRQGLKIFLSSLPALTTLQQVFTRMRDAQDGVIDNSPVDISDETLNSMYALLGVMTDMTVEEFDGLGITNQLALLQGFSLFAPKNQPAATPTTPAVTSTPMP